MALRPQASEVSKTSEVSTTGVVVDEAGTPVAGAEVFPFTGGFDSVNLNRPNRIKSDAAGHFTLKQTAARGPVQFRARTDSAVTGGSVTLQPGKDPIRLVVSPKKAFAMRGSLLDEKGRPLSGATVQLRTLWRYASGETGFAFSVAIAKSGAQGRFEFLGLWPGDEYHIMVESPGHDTYQSPRVRGAPGKTHEFSKIVLISMRGAVDGMIVDSAGKPMAGVRVFNTGDANETISTKTDPSGRFRLEGLRSGPVYIFAEKADCRFTGLRTTSGATGVVIKLLRKDEPLPPSARRPNPQSSFEQQQKVARGMLEKLWAADQPKRNNSGSLIGAMARVDLQRARQWSAETGGRYDDVLRRASIKRVADSDLEDAFSLLTEGGGACVDLRQLALRYAASDPAKAMRCAEEMVVRARALDPRKRELRGLYFPRAGRLVARLGNKEAARKLIDEAAEMVAKEGIAESQFFARGEVATALAPYDLKRALSLLEPVKQRNPRAYSYYVMDVAAAACVERPDESLEMLGRMDPADAASTQLRIVGHLARARPAEALKVLDGMKDEYADRKAEACGWLAASVAPRNKDLAFSLIDRGLAALPQSSEKVAVEGGRGSVGAFLAVQARQIGYPDMESVVYRVLALRPTAKDEPTPWQVFDSSAIMAAVLALADAEAAKEILQGLESRSEAFGPSGSRTGRENRLKGWALAYVDRAEQRLQTELSRIKDDPKPDFWESGFMWMVYMLATPPSERLRYFRGLAFVFLEDED